MKYKPVEYSEINCKYCGIIFKPNRKDKQFCSKLCYRDWGKIHLGHSKGDTKNQNKRAKLKKHPYKKHRQTVCVSCGFVPQHLCQLDVDHIDGDHLNNDPNNLQTLCANCHRLKTALQLGWT